MGKNRILKCVENVVRIRVEKEMHRWPPACRGVLHQPKRPKTKR